MDTNYAFVLVIGILGSSVVHFSQGLMRLAIMRKAGGAVQSRIRWIYIAGVALNFTAPLWMILANRFGPTTLYTSMYAVGLIVLLAFSCAKLGQEFRSRDLIGVLLLIAGTALLGIDGLGNPVDMSTVNPAPLLVAGLTAVVLVWPLDRFGRQHDIIPLGMLVGMLGGVFLALDSLLKGVAQYDSGAAAFLPTTGMGLTLFVVSFIGAGLAFGMTQLAHIRSAKASETIAGYDVAYVALPVLIIPLATGESAGISVLCYSGLVCLALGIYYMGR
ncbi:MAG: hypothetical protein R6U28_07020 [Cyclonatronaceae bacterium]